MKVLLFSKYSRKGASSRLRSLQYIPFLKSCNIQITVSSLFSDAYLKGLYGSNRKSFLLIVLAYLRRLIALVGVFKYDVIWIEKEIFPYIPSFAERMLKFIGKPYVVDYDDAIFHNYDSSPYYLVRLLLGTNIDSVMKGSSCVIAGNQYLADRALAAGAAVVRIIPTVVDHARYAQRSQQPGEPLVIGWIGSPSTQKYVLEIKGPLVSACQHYGAVLRLVGATPELAAEFPGTQVDILPWSEDTEAELIREMDVGIMPLPNGPWEQGKCGYKLIQYMACAVPVIGSPVGVNLRIVKETGSGLLAVSESDWTASLTALLDSSMLRVGMGQAGRSAVENCFSLQQQSAKLARILKESAL
tara:strand:+ start:31857 stop:32927 length:1071 start_codon:yes stop_codon:yes gene_type:complete